MALNYSVALRPNPLKKDEPAPEARREKNPKGKRTIFCASCIFVLLKMLVNNFM